MSFLFSFILLINLAYGQEDADVQYKKETEIDFEGLEIEGQLVKPNGVLLQERQKTKFNPLIKLRTDFDHEMKLSVSEIK